MARLGEIEAVVIETDGTLSVIRRTEGEPATTLRDVAGSDERTSTSSECTATPRGRNVHSAKELDHA